MTTRERKNVTRIGTNVVMWNYEDTSGYRAECDWCGWTDGDDDGGDYVWHVKERAEAHLTDRECRARPMRIAR